MGRPALKPAQNDANAKGGPAQPKYVPFRERWLDESWFVTVTNEQGQRERFLRIQVTGLYPRRLGPFKTDRDALVLLETFLNYADEGLVEAFNGLAPGMRVVIEDDLILQHVPGLRDTRSSKRNGDSTYQAGRKGR